MERSMISRCQIQSLPSRNSWDSWDHRSCMKHGSSFGDGFSITDANWKIMRAISVSLCSQASFRAPLFIGPGRANSLVHLVKATSSADKGGEGGQSKTSVSNNSVLGVFGVFGYLFKVGLDILTKKKEEFEDIEKKIENAADVVEKVADTLEKAAKSTEEIAEKVEGESPKDGKIYKAAEMLDKISETVAKDAQILENQAENIEATVKSIDEAIERAEDAADSIAGEIASAVSDDHDKNSSRETVKTKNI